MGSGQFPIVLTSPRAGNLIAGIVIALAGLGFIWCAFIAGLFVRGYFGTRHVPRAAITGITAWPSIMWTDARGRRRRTVVNALNLYRSGFRYQPRQSVIDAADSRIDTLRDWAMSAR
ncbi:MAG TPA: hypothetical protein VFQ74_10415 [Pseudolysinimonas sp.]|nr:hypothetical protein [Pseudolysinimonas sp.]